MKRLSAKANNGVFTTLFAFSVSGKFHVVMPLTFCEVSAVTVSNVFHYHCCSTWTEHIEKRWPRIDDRSVKLYKQLCTRLAAA